MNALGPTPSIKANSMNGLLAPINSFVATTGNNITNAVKAANTTLSTAVNAAKNNAFLAPVAAPLAASIEAMPAEGPSMGLIAGVAILLVISAIVLLFHTQIVQGANYIIGELRKLFGAGEKEVVSIVSDISEETDQLLNIPTVNKFVPGKKQVFNVSENRYTYSDAEPLCRALGAELATYEQVQQAWAEGADWCNYGWVKGQGAVYPTQKETWEKLQTSGTPDQRLACGMPGVNGGYFDNPELRFGVNCFGAKPSESEHDLKVQLKNNIPPLTPEAHEQQKKELAYRANAGQIGVLPFRSGAWSE